MSDPSYVPRPKTITTEDFRFIQQVIANTTTPAWVNHVPKNFGEAAAGSIKADEWRLVGTIYLPIALVVLWAEKRGIHADYYTRLLAHSMALCQATTIICRYTTSPSRAEAYKNCIKFWLGKLIELYPHTNTPRTRTNPHIAMHGWEFLLIWGAGLNWWAFPVERLIGSLGKIKTNGHLGGRLLSSRL